MTQNAVGVNQTWDDWLAGLSGFDHERAIRLRAQAEQLGRPDADAWARDEVVQDRAYDTRQLVVGHLWDRAITAWEKPGELDRLPAAQRLLAAGGALEDIVRVMRVAAIEAASWTLLTIDEGEDEEAPAGSMGWRLMELDPRGRLTGRDLDGLQDDLTDILPFEDEDEDEDEDENEDEDEDDEDEDD